MDATVIICTRNRASSLARTLTSIEMADRPAGFTWELVVVDNGSTDGTTAVLTEFSSRLPLAPTTEPKPGKSNACNHGIAVARGDYLIWIDDDVIVEPGWLSAYAAGFERWPEAALFGGKVLPVLEEPVSSWFAACQHEFSHLLAKRDFGESPLPLSIAEDRLPFGANYAARAAEQRRFPFDPALGPVSGRYQVGEETQVLRAILDDGNIGHYLPNAVVRHMISPNRQTTSYVRSYYRAHGDGVALNDERQYGRCFAGSPLWLWRQLTTGAVAYTWTRAFSSPNVWAPYLKRYAYMQGYRDGLKRRDKAGIQL
jgi:glycosyltransferase involved in cell wall biosynthesis